MRASSELTVLSMLLLACGGGAASSPSGVPVPTGTRVSLQFGRAGGARYHYVARDQLTPGSQGARLEGWERWAVAEITLYVTEQPDDSLEAHLVRVKVDSSRRGSEGRASLGPFPGFVGWFNGRRERLDTLASEPAVEGLRRIIFNGTVPLPAGPVRVGDSWTADASHEIEQIRDPMPPAGVRTKGTLKGIRVVDGDTLADLALAIHIRSTVTPRNGGRPVELIGDLGGSETFSVNQGMSVRLKLDGRIELYAMSRQVVAMNETIERALLP